MRESNRRPQYRLAALSMAVLIAAVGLLPAENLT